ncbi:hypothetical protein LX90_007004 [Lentzea flava]|nr:hypothetical protein [Lentzea flava]MCP2203281.1 hypothetical protein [Lentzea flava]
MPLLGSDGLPFRSHQGEERLGGGHVCHGQQLEPRLGLIGVQHVVHDAPVPFHDVTRGEWGWNDAVHRDQVSQPAEPLLLRFNALGDGSERAEVIADLVLNDLFAARIEQPPVQAATAQTELLDRRDVVVNSPTRALGVVLAGHMTDPLHSDLEVRHVRARGPDDRDGERRNGLGQLRPHLLQGAVGVRGDEHTLALREKMRQQGGDGVSLARSRRTLHKHLRLRVDLGEDAQLAVVDRQRQEGLGVEVDQGAGLG